MVSIIMPIPKVIETLRTKMQNPERAESIRYEIEFQKIMLDMKIQIMTESRESEGADQRVKEVINQFSVGISELAREVEENPGFETVRDRFRVAWQHYINPKEKHRQVAVLAIKGLMGGLSHQHQEVRASTKLNEIFSPEEVESIVRRYDLTDVSVNTTVGEIKDKLKGVSEDVTIAQYIKDGLGLKREPERDVAFLNKLVRHLRAGVVIEGVKSQVASVVGQRAAQIQVPNGLLGAYVSDFEYVTKSTVSKVASGAADMTMRMVGVDTRPADVVLAEEVVDLLQGQFVALQLTKKNGGLEEYHIEQIAKFQKKAQDLQGRTRVDQLITDLLDLVCVHVGAILVSIFGSEVQKTVDEVKADIRKDMRQSFTANFQNGVQDAAAFVSEVCGRISSAGQVKVEQGSAVTRA